MGRQVEQQEGFTRLLEVGERLMGLLRPPLTEEGLQQIEALLEERQQLLTSLLAAPQPPDHNEALLRQLLDQQRALEAQTRLVMAEIQRSFAGFQSARDQLRHVGTILRPGARSRWVNEKR